MISGIDHIQLAMPEGQEDIARQFFGGVLGMNELEKPESLKSRGGVWFACGVQEVHLGVEVGFRPAKKAHPAFLVADLSALVEQLEAQGIEMIVPPVLPRAKRIFVNDPFGNRIELIERR